MKFQMSVLKVAAVYALKFLITCAFLYWALSRIDDQGALKDHFYQALQSPLWLVAGLFFAGVSIFAGALR
jgi:hypothetical protein